MTAPERWLRRQAALTPHAVAMEIGDHHWDFAGLDQRVDALAARLQEEGATTGQPLAALSRNAEMLTLLSLAAPRLGMAYLPLNPKLTAAQIAPLVAKAGVRQMVADVPPSDDVGWRHLPATVLAAALAAPAPHHGKVTETDDDAIHLIIATSGSTGTPKGAMLRGRNLAAAVVASRRRLSLEPGDVWLGCLPMYHIGGLSTLFRCLEAGATLLLHPAFDVKALAADLTAGKASHVSMVPAMLAQLLDLDCPPPARLRTVLIGGASLPAPLAARAITAGWPICPSYGMSEAASQVATCTDAAIWRPGLAGQPLPGIEIDTAPNGRIRVRGPSVMAGYVNPDLTPGDGLTPDGWFETSDLGGLDKDGLLRVAGRADDVLISGGENVQPLEVENMAGRCPGVKALAITGRTDPTWGDLLVALVVGDVARADFLDWCRRHLPSHQRPRDMIALDSLPLNAGGKLDRPALRLIAAQQRQP